VKIAITGGCGYVGSKIAQRLLSTGHEILIIENFSTSVRDELKDCQIVKCDITNPKDLANLKVTGYDVLLHLAAQSSGPKSFEIPDIDIKINILGTLNMINWCRDNGINRILFASSFAVYGDNPNTEILSEDETCNPKSIYALSKYTCEQLLRIYAEPHGIKWNVLRMFNIYGPGQDLSRNDQGMVSIFLNLIKNRDYIGVQGSLDRFRDFIYIDDVVQGWELCILKNNIPNQVFNIGSGTKTYLSTLIDTLLEVYEKTGQVKVEEVGSTPGDIMGCYADISKISDQLGYNPRFSLKKGIELFKKWADDA
jgi:UDP-glucose 4-epimerase